MNKFVDEAKIQVKAGDGGDGCVAFRREKNIARGGPSGGNGGRGGDIIFKAARNTRTLVAFYYKQHFSAERGGHGMGSEMRGRDGGNLILSVPCGTVVKKIGDDGREVLMSDIVAEGDTFVAAEGGRGGRGNASFKSSTNRAPRTATKGEKGQQFILKLELKLVADVGIIGYPNAGKSTLISKISAARPKIAEYPFTTIVPNLGVVNLGDSRSFTVADIPGIIEKASEGRGLGYRFLKHVERTGILLHVVDISEPGALERYRTLREEIMKYSSGLAEKLEIVVGNKIDMPGSEKNIECFRKSFEHIFLISALTGSGLKNLVEHVWNNIEKD